MRKQILIILLLVITSQLVFGQTDEVTQIYLIRHAEKVKDGSSDPVLTDRGEKRAIHWAEVFKFEAFDAIYSTETKRTIATATPTAVQSGLEIIYYDAKTVDIIALANKHKGQKILIVGHSNTTPYLVNRLIGEERFEEIDSSNNSNLYIVNYSSLQSSFSLLYIGFQ